MRDTIAQKAMAPTPIHPPSSRFVDDTGTNAIDVAGAQLQAKYTSASQPKMVASKKKVRVNVVTERPFA